MDGKVIDRFDEKSEKPSGNFPVLHEPEKPQDALERQREGGGQKDEAPDFKNAPGNVFQTGPHDCEGHQEIEADGQGDIRPRPVPAVELEGRLKVGGEKPP